MDEVAEVLAGRRPYGIGVGDCLDGLRGLPDGCVQTVCTSPPYYGLRDYQTGTWEGGDPNCPHKGSNGQRIAESVTAVRGGGHSAAETGPAPFRASCPRCGAVRVDKQIGLEDTPAAFVARLVEVFAEVRRVLHPTGTLWLNIGDSYNSGTSASRKADKNAQHGYWENGGDMGDRRINANSVCKPKDLLLMPYELAKALRDDGWYLRSEISLIKTSPMPESCRDRPTSATEKLFLLARSATYFYDQEAERVAYNGASLGRYQYAKQGTAPTARQPGGDVDRRVRELGIQEPNPSGRNLWNWWEWSTEPFPEAHFATFPTWLPRRCIRLGTPERGVCPSCGVPWRRVVERSKVRRHRPNEHVKRSGQDGTGNSCGNTVAGTATVTRGWEPGCGCGAEPIPALVLDPFAGSGTTLAVASQLGRRAIGFELNADYAALARKRICGASLVKDDQAPSPPLPLFDV